MSLTDAGLSLEDQGRMIATLRQRRDGASSWDAKARSYVRAPQRWSDAVIQAALGITASEFREAVSAYHEPRRPPHSWTREEMADKVLRFALRRKRWPTGDEWDKRRRELDLPARSSVGDVFRGVQMADPSGGLSRWMYGTSALQAYIVDTEETWERLTPQLILGIRNVTVRRRAMEKYGVDRLLRDGGGTRVQQDDFGTLWRMPSDNETDPHAQWVEVENSTAEPDGTNAHYFLRVPPDVETARAAVAWTFNHEGNVADFTVEAAT